MISAALDLQRVRCVTVLLCVRACVQPLYIMTSPMTDVDTRAFFASKGCVDGRSAGTHRSGGSGTPQPGEGL